MLSTLSQQNILRRIQAHCETLESTDINCSSLKSVKHFASCGTPVKKTNKKNSSQSLSHTLFWMFFFLYPPAKLCSAEERRQNTETSIIHTQNYGDTQSNVRFIWNLNPKCGSRCTNTQKEASIIKASVGPGEQRSLLQTPELPHWYHSVQFCSNNSIVCPPHLATLIIMWAHRKNDQ